MGLSASARTLVLGAVLLAAGGAWWFLRADAPGPAESAKSPAPVAAPTPAARAKRVAAAEPAGPPVPSGLSAFADLDPQRDLHGVVVDRDDRPVANARVAAYPLDVHRWSLAESRGETPALPAAAADARSAADGSFRLRLTPGTQTLVRASAAGFAGVDVPYLQAGQTVRIVLDAPTTLRVRVLDGGGSPCAGASVFASSTRRSPERSSWTRSATTGADGSVSWSGLPRGRGARVDLDVSPATGRAPAHAACELEDRDVNETVVTLAGGRPIEGRVVDADTNIGVGGARIFVDPDRPPVVVAAADGRFHFDGWTIEPRWTDDPSNRVMVMADGFARTWSNVPGAKETKPFTIELRRGFEITGVVAGPDRRPLEGALVIAMATEWSSNGEARLDATTDAAGVFRLGWLRRAEVTPLSISAAGFAPSVIAVSPPPKGQATADVGTIVVGPGRVVRGRLVDTSGAAMSGMFVRVIDPNDERADLYQFRTTLDDGRFAFESVGAGKRVIRVSGPGPDQNETKTDIVVPADADPPEVTIVYGVAPPEPPKEALVTRVVDEDGQPVAGAKVFVGKAVDGRPQFVSTRFEGELAQRYQYRHVWLRPGATEATVVLKRAEPISGTLVDAAGNPLGRSANAAVTAFVGSRQVGFGMTDAEGRFAIGVPPGATVDLEARANQREPAVGARSGVVAGSHDVTIEVVPVAKDRTLDVVLEMPEGVVAGKCDLIVDTPVNDNRNTIRATFDAAGHAHLEGLPRAPVTVRAMVRTAGDPDAMVSVGLTGVRVAADAESVRIVVPGFRTVRGRVVDESGAPSPNAYIASTAAFNLSQAVADAQGVFALRVPGNAEAPFLVVATKFPFDRKAPFNGWEIVEDGADRELVIVLKPSPAK